MSGVAFLQKIVSRLAKNATEEDALTGRETCEGIRSLMYKLHIPERAFHVPVVYSIFHFLHMAYFTGTISPYWQGHPPVLHGLGVVPIFTKGISRRIDRVRRIMACFAADAHFACADPVQF